MQPRQSVTVTNYRAEEGLHLAKPHCQLQAVIEVWIMLGQCVTCLTTGLDVGLQPLNGLQKDQRAHLLSEMAAATTAGSGGLVWVALCCTLSHALLKRQVAYCSTALLHDQTAAGIGCSISIPT